MCSLAQDKLKRMNRQQIESLKGPNGKISVTELPSLAYAIVMTQTELLKALHKCPASVHFGKVESGSADAQALSQKEARKLVIDMIRDHTVQKMEVIPESDHSSEKES